MAKVGHFHLSKEFILLLNNLFITITTFAILLGTLYPLITSSLDLGKISVGAPYFNFIFAALMLPIVFLMAPAIFSSWNKTNLNKLFKKLRNLFFYSIIISYVFINYLYDTDLSIIYLAIFLAVFTILSSFLKAYEVFYKRQVNNKKTRFLMPGFMFANILSHIGIGVLIIGVTLSTYFSSQKEVVMNIGSEILIENILASGAKKGKTVEKSTNPDSKPAKTEVKSKSIEKEAVDLSKLTVATLKEMAKANGVKGISSMKKDDLIKSLS